MWVKIWEERKGTGKKKNNTTFEINPVHLRKITYQFKEIKNKDF